MTTIPELVHVEMYKQRNKERGRQTEKGVVVEVIFSTSNVAAQSV